MIRKLIVLTIAITSYFFFKLSWLALISIALTILLSFEEVLRVKLSRLNTASSVGKLRSRLSTLPYSEESYNANFKECFPKNKHSARQDLFVKSQSFASPLLNFENGLRKTSFIKSDKKPKNRIFIFGGSTIDCLEVPDDYTIASRLQKLLNSSITSKKAPTHPKINSNLSQFDVINCGVAGASLSANYHHYQQLTFSEGDICIFYFGINETNFGETIFTFKAPLQKIPGISHLRNRKLNNFLLLSRLIRLLSTFDRDHFIFKEKISNANQILTSLERSCAEREIEFIAILQPFINTRSPISHHDRGAFSQYWPRKHFDPHSSLFQRFADEFKARKFFVDGRTFFDRIDLDVYTEWCHTNYLGNEIVAENFYRIVSERCSKKLNL